MFCTRNRGQKRIDIKQKPYEPAMSKKRMSIRSTVCGNNNVEQLILAQLSRDDESCRDFSACYQSSSRYFTPHCTATSHAAPPKQNLPEYPLVQYIRWNPHVETSSFEDSQKGRDSKYDTCFYCPSAEQCPSNISLRCTDQPRYRTSIMTFSNKCTMTSRLVDVGCGYSSLSSPRGSAESVRSAENEDAVRHSTVDRSLATRRGPTPILKKYKNWYEDPYYDGSFHGQEYAPSDEVHRIPELDVEDYPSVPGENRLISLDYDRTSSFRKIIYNEGISDEVVKHNRPLSQRERALISVGLKHNHESFAKHRNTLFWKEDDSCRIPYSHKSSRYHQCCKKPTKESHYLEEPNREEDAKDLSIDKACLKNPVIFQVSTIKKPKKVLTSKRDIETYLAVSALDP